MLWLFLLLHAPCTDSWTWKWAVRNNHCCNFLDSRRGSIIGLYDSSSISSSYIPSQEEEDKDSSYSTIPAGLRGEAIRSALRMKTVGWTWSDKEKDDCIVEISGPGVIDFLNAQFASKFDNSAIPTTAAITTNTPFASAASFFRTTCWLTRKGRVVDMIQIGIVSSNRAFLRASSYNNQDFANRLETFIFPMDRVQIKRIHHCFAVGVLSTQISHIQNVWTNLIVPNLSLSLEQQQQIMQCLPTDPNQSILIPIPTTATPTNHRLEPPSSSSSSTTSSNNNKTNIRILANDEREEEQEEETLLLWVLPSCGLLPSVAGWGYTWVFLSPPSKEEMVSTTKTNHSPNQPPPQTIHAHTLGSRIWKFLISDACPDGPVPVGPLEYESLRIETGTPRMGFEMTGAGNIRTTREKYNNNNDEDDSQPSQTPNSNSNNRLMPASPLELHLVPAFVDVDKGCYLGQEGVASMLRNPRGPPRSLYQVVFANEYNHFDDHNNKKKVLPAPGDTLFVLGSNESIPVGVITSVAEPNSTTGGQCILALALISRSDSILRAMSSMNITISSSMQISSRNEKEDAGVVLDPLDGLEVIVENSTVVGQLQTVPARKFPNLSRNGIFDDSNNVQPTATDYLQSPENKRKNTKEEVLQGSSSTPSSSSAVMETTRSENQADKDDDDLLEREANRKAEKMKILQQRAQEAMARRKAKKQT